MFAELRGRGTTTNLQTVPKTPTPNKTLVKFFYPKTSRNRKFRTLKISPRSSPHPLRSGAASPALLMPHPLGTMHRWLKINNCWTRKKSNNQTSNRQWKSSLVGYFTSKVSFSFLVVSSIAMSGVRLGMRIWWHWRNCMRRFTHASNRSNRFNFLLIIFSFNKQYLLV